jgi:branched-chain amino acid transport system ATP-binding protein
MLYVNQITGGYGQKRILNQVSFHITPSEIVGLVGPNGSGKSTILKAIYGLLKVDGGEILFLGSQIHNRKPSINAAEGIGYVPQGSKIFDRLSVQENLELGGFVLRDKKELFRRIDEVYALFPVLARNRNRFAGKLSGGERQILGLSRGLIQNPRLILLDEPSIGLSPKLVSLTMNTICQIRKQFSITILVVEQNVREVLKVVDRVYVLRLGQITLEERQVDSQTENKIRQVFLT